MIDKEIKEKLIKELEKSGNVFFSCMKFNIHRSTYYRWKKDDRNFKSKANDAVRLGIENNCDVAEWALMANIKEKEMGAIKYYLGHNSQRYKPNKSSTVVFKHEGLKNNKDDISKNNWKKDHEYGKKMSNLLKEDREAFMDELDRNGITLEDILDLDNRVNDRKDAEAILAKYENMGGIPQKPDGSVIKFEELLEYEKYIEDFYKKKLMTEEKKEI